MKIAFIGYGDIATRTAARLAALEPSWHCVGLCRTPTNKAPAPNTTLVAGNSQNEQDLRELLYPTDAPIPDAVVITLTPAEYSAQGYHEGYVVPCRHLQHLLAQHPQPPLIIYISSTSVYGERDGEWVTHTTPAQPTQATGKALLTAEQLLQSAHPQAKVHILRCSGIYGPGRERLLQNIRSGKVTASAGWTNRIHVEDVAGFIVHLLQQPQPDTYIVSDDEPTPAATVYRFIAKLLSLDLQLAEQADTGARGSKRLANDAMKATGYQLQYPSYQLGYSDLLRDPEA